MSPAEIRLVRGSLSRAAFARHLGVTPLTVLRWELPEGSKEARRPRARMIEELHRLAAEGVGTATRADGAPLADETDDEDDASEPIAAEVRPSAAPAAHVARSPDEARVRSLIQRLHGESWRQAEAELQALLSGPELVDGHARTLAALGVVQMQNLTRLDVHGALALLQPILEDAALNRLPRRLSARAHVLGALLFAAPDSRVFEPGRANVHAAFAEPLLDAEDDDLRVLLGVARVSATRYLGPHALLHAYEAARPNLDHARSPLALCLATQLRSIMAGVAGDVASMLRLEAEALEGTTRLGLTLLTLGIFADRTHVALRRTATPAEVLAITGRARAAAAGHPPTEPFLRILAAECEALARQGKFAEAEAVYREALSAAECGGLPLHALVAPAGRMFLLLQRSDELEALAQKLGGDGAPLGGRSLVVHVHVLALRAVIAFPRDQSEAHDLATRACQGIEALSGASCEHIVHDAYLIAVIAGLLSGGAAGAQQALRRCEAVLEQRPSLWHAATLRRMCARVDSLEGRFVEAEHKLTSALATFTSMGDVVQQAQSRMDLALAAKLTGADDADARIAGAVAELARLGVSRPPSLFTTLRAELLMVRPNHGGWAPPSWVERIAAAVERMAVPGLPLERLLRELEAVLRELFPERMCAVEHDAGASDARIEHWVEIGELAGSRLRCGASGQLDVEQRAALRALAAVVALRVENLRARVAHPEPVLEPDAELPGFIAAAPATRRLRREIAQLARSHATILIGGESGSGKEVVARALHDLSPRAQRPYVAFNCASVPHDLFEGQLFGYRKGAFTGAASDSPGVIRAADGGTLFLDEIGELPLDTQPKLLRFLENAEVFPLGEHRPRRVEVRVLAASHRDLGRLVREGRFREDLFYRLNVVPLQVPPLRERREDIVALARLFLTRLTPQGAEPPELGPDAITALKAHSWPGNVRELRNVIERALAYAPGAALLAADQLRIGGWGEGSTSAGDSRRPQG
jgi:predicted ATP-dependent protease